MPTTTTPRQSPHSRTMTTAAVAALIAGALGSLATPTAAIAGGIVALAAVAVDIVRTAATPATRVGPEQPVEDRSEHADDRETHTGAGHGASAFICGGTGSGKSHPVPGSDPTKPWS